MFLKLRGVLFLIFVTLQFSTSSNAGIIFSETFDNNDNNWSQEGGWQIVDGAYRFSKLSDFHSQVKSLIPFGQVDESNLASGPYTISYRMRFNDNLVGFLMGLTWEDNLGNQNWMRASNEYNLMEVSDIGAGTGGTGDVEMFGDGIMFSANEWYHFDLKVSADKIDYFLDDELITTKSNADVNLYSMDKIGFSTWRSSGEFDDLTISVPEPSSIVLFSLAGALIMFRRKHTGLGQHLRHI